MKLSCLRGGGRGRLFGRALWSSIADLVLALLKVSEEPRVRDEPSLLPQADVIHTKSIPCLLHACQAVTLLGGKERVKVIDFSNRIYNHINFGINFSLDFWIPPPTGSFYS